MQKSTDRPGRGRERPVPDTQSHLMQEHVSIPKPTPIPSHTQCPSYPQVSPTQEFTRHAAASSQAPGRLARTKAFRCLSSSQDAPGLPVPRKKHLGYGTIKSFIFLIQDLCQDLLSVTLNQHQSGSRRPSSSSSSRLVAMMCSSCCR